MATNNPSSSSTAMEIPHSAGFDPNRVQQPSMPRGPWFERRIMAHLNHSWSGPSIALTVSGRHYQLGASGVPRTEIVLHDPALLRRIWHAPTLTFGEGFMHGEIEVKGSMRDLMSAVHMTCPENESPWYNRALLALRGVHTRISPRRATANARHHYNIGNEFYKLWLDPTLTYSCAYFRTEQDDLATAQRQKLDLLCRKVRLAREHTLLDIGCGWGSLIMHAARNYGCECVGITAADDQAAYIEALAQREGLTQQVRVIRGDWRELKGRFDRIISVGMFEHVGRRQYAEFFSRWRDLLADGGLSLLHTIGRMSPASFDPWIDKYIFPGGDLPTIQTIARHAARTGLDILDVENLKRHYARTLGHWITNFTAAQERMPDSLGEEFIRMWMLYLYGSEAGFRAGGLQLWQVVMAKDHNHAWPLNREVGATIGNAKAGMGTASMRTTV